MIQSVTRAAVKKRISSLPRMIEEAAFTIRKSDADALILNWRNGIATRSFGLRALRPKTVARKRVLGYGKPNTPLYGLGFEGSWTYLKALRKYRTSKGWVVKFSRRMHHSGLTEEQLFRIHEYGAIIRPKNGKPFRIPARPAFFKAYQRTMQGIKDRSEDVLRAAWDYVETGRKDTFRHTEANARRLEGLLGKGD